MKTINTLLLSVTLAGHFGLVAMAADQQTSGTPGSQSQSNGPTVAGADIKKSRLNMAQFDALLPKSLGPYHFVEHNGVYQTMVESNRIQRFYSAGDKRLDLEILDTGGFTDSYIKSKQWLSLKVGALTVNKYEVLLLDGHRALLHKDFFGGGNEIEIAWDNRYEIRIKSKFEDYGALQKFAFEIGGRLARASGVVPPVK